MERSAEVRVIENGLWKYFERLRWVGDGWMGVLMSGW